MRKLLALLGIGMITTVAFAAPVIPTETRWLVSYETLTFDTGNGDLGMNQYAVDPDTLNGQPIYYIRTEPQSQAGVKATTDATAIQGKQEVAILAKKDENNPDCTGCSYYSEFQAGKQTIRVPYQGRYNDLKEVKNTPQPTHTVLASATEVMAAIAFDNVSTSTFTGSGSSFSWSHTSTGSNLALYVGISSILRTVSSVTYNGTAMTKAIQQQGASGDVYSTGMYLANPSTGANTVSVTLSASDLESFGGAITLTGVDQTTPVNASSSAPAFSDSVTVGQENSWIVDNLGVAQGSSLTVGAGQTSRWNELNGGGDTRVVGSSKGPVSTGSQSMSYTGGIYDPAIVLLAFSPYVAAEAATSPVTTLSGDIQLSGDIIVQ